MTEVSARTLVFSFDGTGNEPDDATGFKKDESVSNVLKLHVLMGGGLEEDRTPTETPNKESQKTYYYNGIGTREDGETIPLVGWLVKSRTPARVGCDKCHIGVTLSGVFCHIAVCHSSPHKLRR